MPLTDLIRYFNSTDLAGASTLYGTGQGVAAWHDGLHLCSLFQPIVELRSNQVVGHQAFLAARREDGSAVNLDDVYATCQNAASVVHFDRLCRTLHALNFLAQRQHAGGYLQLSVHYRHLLAVPSQHGLVFEAVLKRCGLAPDDIVLELTSSQNLDDKQLTAAVNNYRARGYRIALAGAGQPAERFTPDIIKQALPGLLRDQGVGPRTHADGLSAPSHIVQALAGGIDLGQGPVFGLAQSACVSTHRTR